MAALATEQEDIFNTFQFVRLKIPTLIPYELIENVKGRTFTPEKFYKFQNQQVNNPYNFLFVLIDEESKIVGYLWAIQDWDETLYINTFSILKDYWHKGKIMPKVCEFLDDLATKIKATKVFWATTNEKFFVKKGFKRSKVVLMEYNMGGAGFEPTKT